MGEYAEALLDGSCCQFCGVWNDEILAGGPEDTFEPDGTPWICRGCKEDETPKPQKIACPNCNKMISPIGLKQHQEAKHT